MSSEPNAQVETIETPPPVLTLVGASTGPKTEPAAAAPRWNLAQRILFRFALAYLLLYNLPFPLDYMFFNWNISQPYQELWTFLVGWVGDDVFQVDTSILPNGSGDTTYNYVQVFCFLILALAVTAIWSFLDRRRAHYTRLHEWLRVYVRYALALTMLGYGLAKAIPTQFPSPSLDRLVQPFGAASPMGLLWTFMGASAAYTIFAGLSEMLGGLLLVARRTTLLGALVCIGVLTNVVLMNFCYDVPVKLFSSHLLLMAIFLTLPDLRRLGNLLVFNRRAEPAVIRPLFAKKWLNRGAVVLRTVLVAGVIFSLLKQSNEMRREYGDLAPKPPLYGIWNVEELTMDGVVRPALVSDETRWRRVVISHQQMLSIQLMNDSRERYLLKLNDKQIILSGWNKPKARSVISYRKLSPHLLAIEGTFEDHKIRGRLRRVDESKFLLVNRGFHWINEYPFNR